MFLYSADLTQETANILTPSLKQGTSASLIYLTRRMWPTGRREHGCLELTTTKFKRLEKIKQVNQHLIRTHYLCSCVNYHVDRLIIKLCITLFLKKLSVIHIEY